MKESKQLLQVFFFNIFKFIINLLKKKNILGLESFKKTVEEAFPGDQLGILLKGLGAKDVRRGCVLIPQNHKHIISDKVRAQVFNLQLIFFY